jgi:hypothetical protein
MPASLRSLFRHGLDRGLRTSWVLIRVILPTYIVVDLLKSTPIIPAIGRAFGPMMHPLGLPGEAAMALVLGLLVNLYAAIGVLAPLGLTTGQVTVCALVLGLAHSLILESAVLRTLGTRYLTLTLYRLAIALLAGFAAAAFLR